MGVRVWDVGFSVWGLGFIGPGVDGSGFWARFHREHEHELQLELDNGAVKFVRSLSAK